MLRHVDAPADDQGCLVALLRCPVCGASVESVAAGLVCHGNEHRFDTVEGVHVLIDDHQLQSDPQYAGQRRYFDAEFRTYGRYRLERWRRSYLDRLRDGGILEGPTPLVDVGVGGSGYTVIEAARMGRWAVGCDLSLEGLVRARAAAAAEGVERRTLWVCCSAEQLPLAPSAFGAALAIAVLEHVPDDGAALAELARVLHPHGVAWVTVPHALRHIAPILRVPNVVHDRRLGHLRRYEASGLAAAGQRAGLAPAEVQFTGHPIKVVQLVGQRLGGALGRRFWWWCERRDLRRRDTARGSMQLSMVFRRA